MEHIRHAIERSKAEDALRARARPVEKLVVSVTPGTESVDRAVSAGGPHGDVTASRFERLELKPRHLQANRIIAHDTADPRTKSFDMLRTQVLQTMDAKKWRFLAVTSPSPGCGKTVTAINLALSIARRPDRSVLLVDLDLNKPKIADRLGVKRSQGVVGVLQGHTRLEDAVFEARVGDCRMCVMPSETTLPRSAEWMASRQMTDLLHSISRTSDFGTIILDLLNSKSAANICNRPMSFGWWSTKSTLRKPSPVIIEKIANLRSGLPGRLAIRRQRGRCVRARLQRSGGQKGDLRVLAKL
jgi:hypothetical protein